ncbi:cupin domain-containing protein [Belnapia sp. T18]|uniref:Cupin domain-containing protein n=1 Tax=Belnapia arida TaxID=2804533 RepID=A0ABS1UCH4_9PROT|nr:cupin domain-containing protein [Belnapia arida]MBL6082358.1 cupin domain-containing protein [Belnapia arida]
MSEPGRTCPDKATFDAELDRLTGVYLKLKAAAQKQGIEIETAAHQAAKLGLPLGEGRFTLRMSGAHPGPPAKFCLYVCSLDISISCRKTSEEGGLRMLTRRVFSACWICSTAGLVATAAEVQQAPQLQSAGLKRTVLNQTELPGGTHVVIQVLVEVPPNSDVEQHVHPGIETGYVLEGTGMLYVEGRDSIELKPGMGLQIPQGVPHSAKNGPAVTKLISTLTVEKGKPAASPA